MTNHRPPPYGRRGLVCAWKAPLLLSNQAAQRSQSQVGRCLLTMWNVKDRAVAVAAEGGLGGTSGCERRDRHLSLTPVRQTRFSHRHGNVSGSHLCT